MRKTILACVTAVMIVSATSATAASLITSSQIKDGTIKGRDIAKNTVTSNKLSPGLRRQLARASAQRGSALSSSSRGPAGANGTNGANGSNGAKGDKGQPGTNGSNGSNGSNGGNGLNADGTTTERVRSFGDGGFADTTLGDADAVLGGGKLNLTADTTTLASVARLLKTLPSPQLVDDITVLNYTYAVAQSNGPVAPVVRLNVIDTAGANNTSTLVFEPTYTDGTLAGGKIDALTGQWWSYKSIQGAENGATTAPGGLQTLASMASNNPDMKVTSISIEAGMDDGTGNPWTGFEGSVDQLSLGFADEDPVRYEFG